MSKRRTSISRFLPVFLALATVPGPAAGQQTAPAISAPATPAATLTRPVSVASAPDAAGFIRRWLILEPVRTAGALTDSAVRAAVAASALPDPPPPGPADLSRATPKDADSRTMRLPQDGDTVRIGETDLRWHAVDTTKYNVNLFHFARAQQRPTSNVLFWVATVVNLPQDMTGVRLAIGSNAASVWWVDGEEVITLFNDRQTVVDDGVSGRLALKRGPHVLRAAIINAGGATDFCARLLDKDDRPITAFTVELPRERHRP